MTEKNPEARRAISWGSGRRNSDHHPKAVILSLGRACPGEIGKGGWFSPVLPLELFPRRPLFAEDRWGGYWKTMIPPSLMIRIPPARTPTITRKWGWERIVCPVHLEKGNLWPGSLAFGGITRKKHRPSYFGFRIADFRFYRIFLVFVFQSAFRNRHSAIWRGRKGLGFLSERSRGNRFLRPAPAGAVREPPLPRPSFLNRYTQRQIR